MKNRFFVSTNQIMKVSSVVSKMQISLTQLGAFQIVGTIFSYCRVGSNGGAIFFDNSQSNLTILFTGFDHCGLNGIGVGGAFYLSSIFQFLCRVVCFQNCSADHCASYVMLGYQNDKFWRSNMNFTSECSPFYARSASTFYARTNSLFYNNNISRSKTDTLSSGINFGNQENGEIVRFLNLCESQGPGFMRFHSYLTTQTILGLSYCNFINNVVNSSWSWFRPATNHKILIKNSVFYNCPSTRMILSSETSMLTIDFADCSFSNIYNSVHFSNCITNNCFFSIEAPTNDLELIVYGECWGDGTQIVTNNFNILNPKYFYIPSNIFIFFVVNE